MSVARTHHYIPHHRFVTTTELAGTRYDTETVDRFTQAIIYVNETLLLTSSRVLRDYLTLTTTEQSFTYHFLEELYLHKERTVALLHEAGYTVEVFESNPQTKTIILTIRWEVTGET